MFLILCKLVKETMDHQKGPSSGGTERFEAEKTTMEHRGRQGTKPTPVTDTNVAAVSRIVDADPRIVCNSEEVTLKGCLESFIICFVSLKCAINNTRFIVPFVTLRKRYYVRNCAELISSAVMSKNQSINQSMKSYYWISKYWKAACGRTFLYILYFNIICACAKLN